MRCAVLALAAVFLIINVVVMLCIGLHRAL